MERLSDGRFDHRNINALPVSQNKHQRMIQQSLFSIGERRQQSDWVASQQPAFSKTTGFWWSVWWS
ncbi:hypothetical protein ACSC89_004511 [Salmonella enterica subsp. enterica]|nr:hypothetical protein [Salmonella enterica subsp. enterica]EEH9715161.1 hypothetical protein [Salmonella enterica subsp. enterica serovar Vancouver]